MKERLLVLAENTSNASRRASNKDTRDQRQGSKAGDSTTTAGGQTRKHTNVDTERTNVTESSKHKVGDEDRPALEGRLDQLELRVGDELVGDDLGGQQLRDGEQVLLGDTHAPGEGVEDVAEDEGESKVVDGPEVTDVGQETVDGVQQRDNAEHVAEDERSDADTEPGTVGEGVQGVDSIRLFVDLNVDRTGSDGGLGLGDDHLGGSDGGGDRHDGSGDEVGGRNTHLDIGEEDGTGNGGETRGKNLEELGVGHEVEEALHQHCILTLTDEGRSGSDDSLGTGDAHELEEEPGKLANGPGHDTEVGEEDDEGNEEDDGRERVDEKVVLAGKITPEEGGTTDLTLSEQIGGSESEPLGEAEESAGLEDEETNDDLKTETGYDGLELDGTAASGNGVEEAVDEEKTEKGAGTVAVSRLGHLLDTESRAKVESEESNPADSDLAVVGHLAPRPGSATGPDSLDGVGKGSLGDVAVVVEEDEQDEEPGPDGGDDPSVAGLLANDTGQPPCEDEADESHVKDDAGSLVGADRVPELAGTARLTLRVWFDGLDGRTAAALEVAVGRRVGELVVSGIVVGAGAGGSSVLLNRSVLGELRAVGSFGGHFDGERRRCCLTRW